MESILLLCLLVIFGKSKISSYLSLILRPICHLQGHEHSVVAVSFSPVFYKLREAVKVEKPMLPLKQILPYRMIFAIICSAKYGNSIVIYDTQSAYPILVVEDLHNFSITDLSWSHDGKTLMCSSKDSCCSVIQFDNEFGSVVDQKGTSAEFSF